MSDKQRVVLVTGGMGGLGETITTKMIDAGYKVAVTYSPGNNKHAEWVAGMKANGYDVVAVACDVADFDSCAKAVGEVRSGLGEIDVLVNNAGITRDQLLMRMSEEDWDNVIATNLKSVFNMTKAVMRTMLKQRSGSIINMSSVVGVKGNAGQSNYAASKAGIIGFTKSVALELGSRNIRSNSIAPGFIETEMTGALDEKVVEEWRQAIPLKRGGTPADVANACVFLGSDLSAYITGQTLHVCGGMLT